MAKNYQDIYNSVYVTGNKMDWTNAMIRGNGIPLDIYSVFDTYAKAVTFAATNAVAYEGQVLAVTENGDTTVYVITPAKQGSIVIDEVETDIYLKEVGSATLGDDKTIVLKDGVLSLKNFGTEYYKYYPAVEADAEKGVEKQDAHYEKTTGWIEGLQPKVINSGTTDAPVYEIAWYEPSSTTVEGLSESISTLTERVATAEGTITEQGTLISNNKKDIDDIKENKADKATTLAGYGITDAYTKDEVNGLVSGAFHFRGSVDYYSELVAKTDMVEGDVYIVKYVGTEGTKPLNAEYAYDGTNWVEFGSTMDLSGYATKEDISDINDLIDDINNTETGILKQAKDYADGLNTDMDTRMSDAEEAIDAINDETTGILANAKSYTDEREVEIRKDITSNEEAIDAINDETTGILANAKAYTDEREVEIRKDITTNKESIDAINNTETGILKQAKDYADGLNTAMDIRVDANTEAIDDINNAETGILKQAKDYADTQDGVLKSDLEGQIGTAKNEANTYTDEKIAELKETVDQNTDDISAIDDRVKAIEDEDFATQISTALSDAKTHTNEEVNKHTTAVNGQIETTKNELTEDINELKEYVDSQDEQVLADAKTYADETITAKIASSNAMVYRGTLGEEGTVSALPTVSVKNGDTYKVITDGIYAEQQAYVGDLFIAVVTSDEETTSIEWTLIPSGDDGNVNTADTLTDGSLVIGKGNKEVTVLANGTEGQILKVGSEGLEYADEKTTEIESTDESIDVTETVDGAKTTYDVKVAKVSTDLLFNGSNVLVLNGGSASTGVVVEEENA